MSIKKKKERKKKQSYGEVVDSALRVSAGFSFVSFGFELKTQKQNSDGHM